MHLKRQQMPKAWPVARKGTKFVVRPSFSLDSGVPLLIALRDMLKVARTRKEVKRALHENNILLNGKIAKEEKNGLTLFDKLTIVPSKKHYKLNLSVHGRFVLEEVTEKESGHKIVKVIDKKILKKKKTQLNLSDGRNALSDISCNVNDSVVYDFNKKNVSKCLEMKSKANVVVFAGKHTGKRGTIISISNERKMAEISFNKEKVNILIKQLMVIA